MAARGTLIVQPRPTIGFARCHCWLISGSSSGLVPQALGWRWDGAGMALGWRGKTPRATFNTPTIQ